MASSYSDLKIELIGTGEQGGTWGITTNTNLGTAIEDKPYLINNGLADTVTIKNTTGTGIAVPAGKIQDFV